MIYKFLFDVHPMHSLDNKYVNLQLSYNVFGIYKLLYLMAFESLNNSLVIANIYKKHKI